MKKLLLILNDKKGEMYIDLCVMIVAFVMALAFVLKAIPPLVLKNELNTFATTAVRRIELTGMVDAQTMNVIEELAEMRNLDPVIKIEADYIYGTNKIQIDKKITVVAEHDYDIGFGPFGSYPITLRSKAVGYSEVYFKE